MKVLIIGGAEYSADPKDFNQTIAINDHHPGFDSRFKCEGVELFYIKKNTRLKVGTTELYRNTNPEKPAFEWSNIFRKQYRSKLFTGMYCLEFNRGIRTPFYLSENEGIKEIHLDGMTFYHPRENGRLVKPESMKRDSHDIEANIRYLLEVKRIDARVSFSRDLEEVLSLYS